VPTADNLTCVSFQYGIVNTAGFDAEDIFNEVNNTLKTGLLIATRNITIETLNETYPRDGAERLLRRRSKQQNQWSFFGGKGGREAALQYDGFGKRVFRHVVPLKDFEYAPMISENDVEAKQPENTKGRRRTVVLPSDDRHSDSNVSRRLVFYTDDYPVIINAIVDNPFCEAGVSCSIVSSTVCVLLEEGDDEEEVRDVLVDGIREAILNGDFEAAIPPENQLPSE
jgi:hypothetical protein